MVDERGVIQAPDSLHLTEIADRLEGSGILLAARALLRGAHKRRHQERYRDVNRARVELARLCVERASSELGFGANR